MRGFSIMNMYLFAIVLFGILMLGSPIYSTTLYAVSPKTTYTITDVHYLNGGFMNPRSTDATLDNGKHTFLEGTNHQIGDKIKCTKDYVCR